MISNAPTAKNSDAAHAQFAPAIGRGSLDASKPALQPNAQYLDMPTIALQAHYDRERIVLNAADARLRAN
jgi:hypothetical protein